MATAHSLLVNNNYSSHPSGGIYIHGSVGVGKSMMMDLFYSMCANGLSIPEEDVHLLRPESLWSVWDWLQSHTKWPLAPNPPSSGFLGLVIAVNMCRIVRVYEYVPSMRLTQKCHYYEEDVNLGCTIGIWHPLAAEKLLALAMNSGTDLQIFRDGYLSIKGVSSVHCGGGGQSGVH